MSKLGFYLLMTLFALFFLLPLLWMIVTAFKPFEEWLTPNWIPVNPTLENFTSIFNDKSLPIVNWFFNSLLIALLFTAAILIIDSLAGYAYARLEFPGKNFLFGLMLATLVMPGIMFLIPNYLTVARLDWIGKIQGVIAPGLSGVFGVFFMRQFFQSLPKELEEAASIDGASVWRTFVSVILPLSKGPIITLGIITFLTSWNDFLWSLLILGGNRKALTLPVGLATLQGQYTFDYGKLMAGALVLTLPVLLLYAIFQRYIIRSISMTGIKG
jgi:multiple sugar transport system permease protein